MDTASEQDYALKDGPLPKAKLGSKEGSNRDGGRGSSEDTAGKGSEAKGTPGYQFFGDASGHNLDTYHEPEVKQPSKPTLGDY